MASPTYHLLLILLFTSPLPSLPIAVAEAPSGRSLVDVSTAVGNPSGMFSFSYKSKHTAREFLGAHNKVRRNVGEAPYEWNHSLAQYARWWANERRADCQCIHSGGPYGENMFWGTGQTWRASAAVRNWAQERYDYNAENNSCRPGRMCGHYTQIVWNATTKIGCARVPCNSGGVIIVCNYDPPGNFIGESPFQVLA